MPYENDTDSHGQARGTHPLRQAELDENIKDETLAKAAVSSNLGINLLPQKGFGKLSGKSKFLYWTTKYGRTIVISFQALIIVMLFYKLFLYNNFADTMETIEEKTAILTSLNQTEADLKDVQFRIVSLKKVQENSFKPSSYTELIKKLVPQNTVISTLIMEADSIRLTAQSGSLYTFGQMLSNLSQEKSITKVTLLEAQFDKDTSIFTFNIEITLKKT